MTMNYSTITHTHVISYEGLNVSAPRLTIKWPHVHICKCT